MKRKLYSLFFTFCFIISFQEGKSLNSSLTADQNLFVSKPANGSVGVDAVSLKVTANVVADAKRYTIELSKTSDFQSTLTRTSSTDNQRTLVFTGLEYATKYYVRVKTDNSLTYGKVTSFTTRAEQFSQLTLPIDGADNVDFAVLKTEVSPIHQAKRYTLELSKNSDFSGSVISKTSLTDLQRIFLVELEEQTTYYARVISDVSTRYGTVTSFTTRAAVAQRRFWGVTTSGGEANAGTVFSFSLDSLTFTKHHDNVSAEYLHGSLTPAPNGSFYGMGVQYSTGDDGEVYQIASDGSYSLVAKVGFHFGSLMLASDNNVYVTDDWINLFRGGIVKVEPETGNKTILHRFRSDAEGKNPSAPAIELNSYLYGMTPNGGKNKKGVIYRKKFDGSEFNVVYDFSTATGGSPQGSLIEGTDGYLYGLTLSGGTNNFGTIFKILPDGSNFTKLHDFNGTTGKYPFGDLIQYRNSFYGMASEGGADDSGVIYKINSDGSGFQKLLDFNGVNGSIPMGNLTVDEAGIMYGMTSMGGTNDLGVIFKIKFDGSGFAKLYDFSTGGGNPDGSLALTEDLFSSGSNSARIIVNNSAAAENSRNELAKVYPNPFVNSITVELSSSSKAEEKFSITLTDLGGRIVQQSHINQTQQLGDNLAQGVYIMKIVNGNQVSMHRVVKGQ